MKKIIRLIQLITFIHKIYHQEYSYGYKIPFTNYGIFFGYYKVFKIGRRLKNIKLINCIVKKQYKNCTITGVY